MSDKQMRREYEREKNMQSGRMPRDQLNDGALVDGCGSRGADTQLCVRVCSCLIFRDGVEYVGEGRERFVDVLCLGQSFAFDRRPDGNGWMFGVSDQMYW